ncbi:putative membrane protein [Staphylococcus phage vB_SauM_VL14]|nr:putative membrane protein [Staphylococcus phage vB_SauM_VL14]
MPMDLMTIASVSFIAVVIIDLINDDMSYMLTGTAILINIWAGFYGWFFLLQAGMLLFLLLARKVKDDKESILYSGASLICALGMIINLLIFS